MSIESYIEAAKLLYQENFYEEALCLVCSAIDASAARCYSNKKVSERYKLFLKDNFRTITKASFSGCSIRSIRIKLQVKTDSLKPDDQGYVDLVQIIYYVLRCGLVHNCNIEKTFEFVDYNHIGNGGNNKFYIPKSIILGLIAAVENCQNSN